MQKVWAHKIDCPKLKKDSRRDKRNAKFEKFKKVFAAWGESDIDTSDDESSDQEVVNLCFIAKEENQMRYFSNPTPLMNCKVHMMKCINSH